MDLEIVKEAMNQNKIIDSNLKENILELTKIFISTFPEVDLKYLCQNLKTLKVEKTSNFINRFPLDYNPKINKLTINPKELEKAEDPKNLFMNIVIRLIVTNNGIVGFDVDGSFLALNIGYIAGIANMLVGNEAEYDIYTDEIIACNMFGKLIGDDVLKEAFFTNNPRLILENILSKEK